MSLSQHRHIDFSRFHRISPLRTNFTNGRYDTYDLLLAMPQRTQKLFLQIKKYYDYRNNTSYIKNAELPYRDTKSGTYKVFNRDLQPLYKARILRKIKPSAETFRQLDFHAKSDTKLYFLFNPYHFFPTNLTEVRKVWDEICPPEPVALKFSSTGVPARAKPMQAP